MNKITIQTLDLSIQDVPLLIQTKLSTPPCPSFVCDGQRASTPACNVRRTFSLRVPSHSQEATDCPLCALRCMLTSDHQSVIPRWLERRRTHAMAAMAASASAVRSRWMSWPPLQLTLTLCARRYPFFVFCELRAAQQSTSTVTRFRTTCAMAPRECCCLRLTLTLPSRLLVHDCGGRRWDARRK